MKNLLVGAVLCVSLAGCSNTPAPTSTGSATPKAVTAAATPVASASAAASSATPTPGATDSATPMAGTSATPVGSMTPGESATPGATAEWKEYTPKDGSFTVMLPGTPKVDEADGKIRVGAGVDDKHAFVVSKDVMTELPKDFSEEVSKKIIETMEKDGTKVQKHAAITVQGHPALNLVMLSKDKDEVEMVQIVVGKTLYQLLSIRSAGSEPFKEGDEKKFASSFKINEK